MNHKLILGTVQLGLDYGINNMNGKPDQLTCYDILNLAYLNGINTLDTAEAYGNAIEVIGKYHASKPKFEIISKSKFDGQSIVDKIKRMLVSLNVDYLDTYLLHDPNDMHNELIAEQLIECKEHGFIKSIGVSIYTNVQLMDAILTSWIEKIQLPYNLLDNVNQRGQLINLAKSKNKMIHIRSVFLQGLFFMDLNLLPNKLLLLLPYLNGIKDICSKHNVNMQQLALQYALSNAAIDGVLIGVENKSQLIELLEASNSMVPAVVIEEVNQINVVETDLLLPTNWN